MQEEKLQQLQQLGVAGSVSSVHSNNNDQDSNNNEKDSNNNDKDNNNNDKDNNNNRLQSLRLLLRPLEHPPCLVCRRNVSRAPDSESPSPPTAVICFEQKTKSENIAKTGDKLQTCTAHYQYVGNATKAIFP